MRDWRSAIRKLDWSSLETTLHEVKESKLLEILLEIEQTGAFIIRKPDAELSAKRDAFANRLRTLVESSSSVAAIVLEKHWKYVKDVERGYHAILETLETQKFSSEDSSFQIWSAMLLACDSIDRLNKKIVEKMRTGRNRGLRFPFSTVTVKHDGKLIEQNIDSLFAVYANVLYSTLTMLSWKHKWFKGSRIVIPARPDFEIDFLSSSSNSYLASEWMMYAEADEHVRYFGGSLTLDSQAVEQDSGTAVDLDVLYFTAKLYTRMFETIARERLDARLFEWQLSYAQEGDRDLRISPSGASAVALSPREYLSRDEHLAEQALLDIFYMDLDGTEVGAGELTIRELLRGYASLKDLARTDASKSFIRLSKSDLKIRLISHGLTEGAAHAFISAAIMSKGKRDLYDAPLIEDSEENLWFFGPLAKSAALVHIVTSQAVSLTKNIESKGSIAESALQQIFIASELPVAEIKYTQGGVDYQCDAAVLWDGHLFVFELKNRLLPLGTSVEYSWRFWEKLREDATQCRRIANQIAARPDLIEDHFGKGVSIKAVHPVLLQALPFSLPELPFGVYVYDMSALGRFFSDPSISIVECEPRVGSRSPRIEHVVGSQWSGKTPRPEDLLAELKNPLQLRVSQKNKRWSYREQQMRLSGKVGAIVPTLSRTPEEPSDILRALDWTEEQIQSFWAFQERASKELWPVLEKKVKKRKRHT